MRSATARLEESLARRRMPCWRVQRTSKTLRCKRASSSVSKKTERRSRSRADGSATDLETSPCVERSRSEFFALDLSGARRIGEVGEVVFNTFSYVGGEKVILRLFGPVSYECRSRLKERDDEARRD